MEMEGLKRGLESLKSRNLRITDITTDRHVQVKKYLRTEEPNIRHWFDVWHVAKGLYKKIQTLSRKKGCEILGKWAHSISNHLYWTAASSHGNGDEVEDKWSSVSNHVCNIHEGHGPHYPRCQHDDLVRRKRIKQNSKPHKELKDVILSSRLIKDISQLSPAEQTSKLEAYHKVVCQFAPKFQNFFFNSMKARILLAAIHNNENINRKQACTQDGRKRWSISYPKYKQGGHVVKAVKDECSYGYVSELMIEVISLREEFQTYSSSLEAHQLEVLPPHSSTANRILQRDEAIVAHKSRFNK